jgi:hypothetical protein
MSNLPQKIKLTIHGEEIDFSLTDKREIKYYGKTEASNESLWRTDKLEDNEVFYQTEWGWGVFVNIEERELSLEERIRIYALKEGQTYEEFVTNWNTDEQWLEDLSDTTIPTKLITITYNDKTIESYV